MLQRSKLLSILLLSSTLLLSCGTIVPITKEKKVVNKTDVESLDNIDRAIVAFKPLDEFRNDPEVKSLLKEIKELAGGVDVSLATKYFSEMPYVTCGRDNDTRVELKRVTVGLSILKSGLQSYDKYAKSIDPTKHIILNLTGKVINNSYKSFLWDEPTAFFKDKIPVTNVETYSVNGNGPLYWDSMFITMAPRKEDPSALLKLSVKSNNLKVGTPVYITTNSDAGSLGSSASLEISMDKDGKYSVTGSNTSRILSVEIGGTVTNFNKTPETYKITEANMSIYQNETKTYSVLPNTKITVNVGVAPIASTKIQPKLVLGKDLSSLEPNKSSTDALKKDIQDPLKNKNIHPITCITSDY